MPKFHTMVINHWEHWMLNRIDSGYIQDYNLDAASCMEAEKTVRAQVEASDPLHQRRHTILIREV